MAAAKIHPPSAARIAEARGAGLAPHPSLAGFAAALVGLLAYARAAGTALPDALAALWRGPFTALAQAEPARAEQLALAALRVLAMQLGLLLGAVGACVALALWLAQGPHFGLPRRARRPLASARPSWLAPALGALAACGLGALFLAPALWLEPAGFTPLIARYLGHAGVALALIALVDVASARTAFLRALWLTRREQAEELREAYGAPELRGAREQARRELRVPGAGEAEP